MIETGDRRIEKVEGTALPLRGDDIDTDRIIPARFLRSTSFDGLEDHLFEDDRRMASAGHPFSRDDFRQACILFVNRNFGCGSSREHAGQGLKRWGIRAMIGESFSEIFLGNAVALGLPCLTVTRDDIEYLMARAENDPRTRFTIDLAGPTVTDGDRMLHAELRPTAREAFLAGTWDGTALLLDNYQQVRQVADRLPYIRGFQE